MSKKIVVLTLAMLLATSGVVFAKKMTCTVDAVDGEKVTMTCDGADKLKAGDKVKVSPPKGGAIEGC